MTSRRAFLQAATLAGLPAFTAADCAAAASLPAALDTDLHRLLLDARHPEARALGARFAGTAVRTLPDDDVTRFWLDDIGPAWRARPLPIAGLTPLPVLFCLEQLGLAHGLRVVFHAEHILCTDGQASHRLLRGGPEARLSAAGLARSGPRWPERCAAAIAVHRREARPLRVGPSDASLAPALPAGARLLASWIVAPV